MNIILESNKRFYEINDTLSSKMKIKHERLFPIFAFAIFFDIMLEMNIEMQSHFFQIPDEKSRFDDLHVYSSQDIIITLPTPMTVYDISFLSVSKEEVSNKNELESQ